MPLGYATPSLVPCPPARRRTATLFWEIWKSPRKENTCITKLLKQHFSMKHIQVAAKTYNISTQTKTARYPHTQSWMTILLLETWILPKWLNWYNTTKYQTIKWWVYFNELIKPFLITSGGTECSTRTGLYTGRGLKVNKKDKRRYKGFRMNDDTIKLLSAYKDQPIINNQCVWNIWNKLLPCQCKKKKL